MISCHLRTCWHDGMTVSGRLCESIQSKSYVVLINTSPKTVLFGEKVTEVQISKLVVATLNLFVIT